MNRSVLMAIDDSTGRFNDLTAPLAFELRQLEAAQGVSSKLTYMVQDVLNEFACSSWIV